MDYGDRTQLENFIKLLQAHPDLKQSLLQALTDDKGCDPFKAKEKRRHERTSVMVYDLPPECPIAGLTDEQALKTIVHLLKLQNFGNGLYSIAEFDEVLPPPVNDERRLGLLIKLGLAELSFAHGQFEFIWERKRAYSPNGSRISCVRLTDLAEIQRMFKDEFEQVRSALISEQPLINPMHSFEPYFRLMSLDDIQDIHEALQGALYA